MRWTGMSELLPRGGDFVGGGLGAVGTGDYCHLCKKRRRRHGVRLPLDIKHLSCFKVTQGGERPTCILGTSARGTPGNVTYIPRCTKWSYMLM